MDCLGAVAGAVEEEESGHGEVGELGDEVAAVG